MREIKFRAKEKGSDKWIYGFYSELFNIPIIIEKKNNETCLINTKTVGQYIGLKDKNDKEIYEGDIIKTGNGKIGIVVYDNESCCYFISSKVDGIVDYDTRTNFAECIIFEYTLDIISNIYEATEKQKHDWGLKW